MSGSESVKELQVDTIINDMEVQFALGTIVTCEIPRDPLPGTHPRRTQNIPVAPQETKPNKKDRDHKK